MIGPNADLALAARDRYAVPALLRARNQCVFCFKSQLKNDWYRRLIRASSYSTLLGRDARVMGRDAQVKRDAIKNFDGLEIFRFLCAVVVIFAHYQIFFVRGLWNSSVMPADHFSLPFNCIFNPLYKHGDIAVQLFWTISGFIFFWKYSATINGGAISATKFFVWRFSRLYPIHITTLIIVAILQHQYFLAYNTFFAFGQNDFPHFLLQIGLMSNWMSREPLTFNAPIWSISVEVLVYACFFVIASTIKLNVLISGIVILGAAAMLRFRAEGVISCVEFFFLGGLMQQIISGVSYRNQKIAFAAASICVAAILTAAWHSGHPISNVRLLLLASGLIVVFGLITSVTKLDLSKAAHLGDLTYASYLLQFPIQLAAILIIDKAGINRNVFLSPLALSAFLAVTFCSAWIVYRFFEAPAQNALRSLWMRRDPKLVIVGAETPRPECAD
jgi:peptidoglycan/LPS O-acetylase OafA/YrhL